MYLKLNDIKEEVSDCKQIKQNGQVVQVIIGI